MAEAERPVEAGRRILKLLGMVAGLLVFGLALFLLYRELRSFHPRQIVDDLRGLPVPAILLAVIATAWLTRYGHRHVEYPGDLWRQFMPDGQAPRALRALAGVGAVALVSGGVKGIVGR
jgi:lysylphosphatidylglycerol synthetase-like protein (DUF2156 family)